MHFKQCACAESCASAISSAAELCRKCYFWGGIFRRRRFILSTNHDDAKR